MERGDVVDEAAELDAESLRLRSESGTIRPVACDHGRNRNALGLEPPHRLDQDVEALLVGEAADRTDAKGPIDRHDRGPLLDAVRDHPHLGQTELLAELAPGLLGDGDQPGQPTVGAAEDRDLGRALQGRHDMQRRDRAHPEQPAEPDHVAVVGRGGHVHVHEVGPGPAQSARRPRQTRDVRLPPRPLERDESVARSPAKLLGNAGSREQRPLEPLGEPPQEVCGVRLGAPVDVAVHDDRQAGRAHGTDVTARRGCANPTELRSFEADVHVP